jgi:hypothetical protein
VAWLLACPAWAQSPPRPAPTPAGLWKTFSDSTGEAEALVRIESVHDELHGDEWRGRVVKVFSPPAPKPDPVCERCDGELKNKPVVGLTIIQGLHADGAGLSGGTILDPDSGTVYRCRMRLAEDGRKLEVRGFVGVALFGRTQVWSRAEE